MEKEKRILIVDDNRDFREQLATHLMNSYKRNETVSLVERVRATLHASSQIDERDFSPEPYIIHTASHGEQAYEMVQEALRQGKPYALIFMDIKMPPGWDGVITLEHIWKIDKKVQVVLCSAHSIYSWKEVVDRFGKKDNLLILKKPFDTTVVSQIALALTEKYLTEQNTLTLHAQGNDTNEYLKHIIDGLPAPLILTARDGRIIHWNAAAANCSAIPAEKADGRLLWEVLPQLADHRQKLIQVSKSQIDTSFEAILPSAAGREVKTDVTIYPMGTDSAENSSLIVRILRHHENPADKECLKRLHAISEAIEQLKNDLTNNEEISRLREKLQSELEKLESAARDSEEIIRQALDAGVIPNSDINLVLKETIKHCHETLEKINIEVEYTPDAASCPIPENQLRLMFWNLLVNAAEAIQSRSELADPGKIKVCIDKINMLQPTAGALPETNPGSYWLVKFSDNGIGMDNNTVSRIFEPFFTTKKGCGLGLVLVYNVLKQYNGQVIVESESGRGSQFSIYLPVA